ncbi:hypothetical protein C8J56DRAFT_1061702 [Mycena floridula]|nr:hypothetical protein C8J56DRAFT_1061702 [Mycena floridula]
MAIAVSSVSASTSAAQDVHCDVAGNSVVNADCTSMISLFANSPTVVQADASRRAILTVGGCSIVLVIPTTETASTTRGNLAAKASTIMQVCNNGLGFSAILQGNAVGSEKYCLCSPGTVTQC